MSLVSLNSLKSPNKLNPQLSNNDVNCFSDLISKSLISPSPHGIKTKGLEAVIFESSCLRDPAAAFLGFEKILDLSILNLLNSEIGNITSPLISIRLGIFFPISFNGTLFMVLIFSVISSPISPSPLVAALSISPFL